MQADLSKIKKGELGEIKACSYLEDNGFTIIERNFRTPIGEIDIVALKDKTLHFFEVKTRSQNSFGDPLEALTLSKQKRIRKIASWFLTKYKKHKGPCLFGAIGVNLSVEPAFIECIVDAFE